MATDGDIDFSGYTREQLDAAVARMDHQRYPINSQNLTEEYQRRKVAEWQVAELAAKSAVVAPPDPMLSAPRAFAVTFEPTASFINWLGPSRNDFHLVGSGKLRVDDALVCVTGRRFGIFLGLPHRQTEELGRQFVCNVEFEGSVVRFELRVPGEKVQGVTLWLKCAVDAQELAQLLPAERTADYKPQLKLHVDFEQALIAQSPKTPVTYALIIACVCVYLTTALGTDHLLGFDGPSLIPLGSNFGPYTTDGDWWRLMTSTFLHLGLLHLAFNMWALASFGPMVERLYGSVSYAMIYFVAGIAASLASVAWQPAINSVGASGAIFGIFGALLAAQMRNGGSIPKNVLRPLRYTSSIYIALSLFAGLSQTGVDNAAHLGGIAAGFLMGLALCRPITGIRLKVRELSRRLVQGVALAVCVLAAGVWCAKEEAAHLTGQGLFAQTVHWYMPRETSVVSLWHGSKHLAETLHWSDEAYANWLEREVVPFWAEADRRFETIELAKTSPSYEHLQALQILASGRLDAYQLIVQGLRQHDGSKTTDGLEGIKKGDELIHEKLR